MGKESMARDGFDDDGKSKAAISMCKESMARDGFNDDGKSKAAILVWARRVL